MPPFLSINRFGFNQVNLPRHQMQNLPKYPLYTYRLTPLLRSRTGEAHPVLALRPVGPNAGAVLHQLSTSWFVPSPSSDVPLLKYLLGCRCAWHRQDIPFAPLVGHG